MSQNPIAISTWSVHHLLATLPLEALPVELAQRGYSRVEICHFHLRSQEPHYLRQMGKLFREHGVIIQTLLIDDGDITNPSTREKDMAWIAGWIESAAHLGAEHARVIAGKAAPTVELLKSSVDGLKTLAALGVKHDVRVVTEN